MSMKSHILLKITFSTTKIFSEKQLISSQLRSQHSSFPRMTRGLQNTTETFYEYSKDVCFQGLRFN